MPKIAKLQSALEAKTIWANRLHENMKAVTVENKDLRMVCLSSSSSSLLPCHSTPSLALSSPVSPLIADLGMKVM